MNSETILITASLLDSISHGRDGVAGLRLGDEIGQAMSVMSQLAALGFSAPSHNADEGIIDVERTEPHGRNEMLTCVLSGDGSAVERIMLVIEGESITDQDSAATAVAAARDVLQRLGQPHLVFDETTSWVQNAGYESVQAVAYVACWGSSPGPSGKQASRDDLKAELQAVQGPKVIGKITAGGDEQGRSAMLVIEITL